MDFEELAGWAQFLGTIGAIFGSAFLATRHHDRIAAGQARDQLITFRNLAHIAVRYVEYAHNNLSPGVNSQKYTKDFEVCKSALDAIEYAKMATPTLVYTVVEINHHFDRFRVNFEPSWPRRHEEREVRSRRMTESADVLKRNLAKLDEVALSMGAVRGENDVFNSPNELEAKIGSDNCRRTIGKYL